MPSSNFPPTRLDGLARCLHELAIAGKVKAKQSRSEHTKMCPTISCIYIPLFDTRKLASATNIFQPALLYMRLGHVSTVVKRGLLPSHTSTSSTHTRSRTSYCSQAALEAALEPKIAPAASLTHHTPRRGARFARGCLAGVSPPQPPSDAPLATSSKRACTRKRGRGEGQPKPPTPPRFHDEPEVATGENNPRLVKRTRRGTGTTDERPPVSDIAATQTPAASRAHTSEFTALSSQCRNSSSPPEDTTRSKKRQADRNATKDRTIKIAALQEAAATMSVAAGSVLPPPALHARSTSRTSARRIPMHDAAAAGPSTSKAVEFPPVDTTTGKQKRILSSSGGGGPICGVAPVAISVRLIHGTERQREADWNPELYYTAAGPIYRASKGGKGALQSQPTPTTALIGMLPIRDRGYRGITGGGAHVTVDVVAPVDTLERAAAAIAFSVLHDTELNTGEVHIVNDASASQRKKGKLAGSVTAAKKQAENRCKKGKRVKQESVIGVNSGSKGTQQKMHDSKVKQIATKRARVSKGGVLVAAHACALKPGEASRAFVFEVLAAAVAMHEERHALVRVLGQAETLDLSHTPCIGALYALHTTAISMLPIIC